MPKPIPTDALPGWPRGLSEGLAAAYVGLSQSQFRKFVDQENAPQPVPFPCKRVIWLREDLDAWLDRLAGRTPASAAINPWDAADGIGRPSLP